MYLIKIQLAIFELPAKQMLLPSGTSLGCLALPLKTELQTVSQFELPYYGYYSVMQGIMKAYSEQAKNVVSS